MIESETVLAHTPVIPRRHIRDYETRQISVVSREHLAPCEGVYPAQPCIFGELWRNPACGQVGKVVAGKVAAERRESRSGAHVQPPLSCCSWVVIVSRLPRGQRADSSRPSHAGAWSV